MVACIDAQQLLEEAADLARAVDEVDLQDPVARGTFLVGRSQRERISVPYRKILRVLRPALMREVTDDMPGARVAELPTVFGRETGREVV
jgi:hypothetical protein